MNWIRLYNFPIVPHFFYNFIAVLKLLVFLAIAIFALKISNLLPEIKTLAIKLIIYFIYQNLYFFNLRSGQIRFIILAIHI